MQLPRLASVRPHAGDFRSGAKDFEQCLGYLIEIRGDVADGY